MSLESSAYHSFLMVTTVSFALVLLFVSGVVSPVTSSLSLETGKYMASVMNASASVDSNEYNDVTAQFSAQQRALDARDQVIKEREIELGLRNGEAAVDYTSWILSILVFILLVLIVLNYILDFLRSYPVMENKPLEPA